MCGRRETDKEDCTNSGLDDSTGSNDIEGQLPSTE
jgi:hypothetical protein